MDTGALIASECREATLDERIRASTRFSAKDAVLGLVVGIRKVERKGRSQLDVGRDTLFKRGVDCSDERTLKTSSRGWEAMSERRYGEMRLCDYTCLVDCKFL